MPVLLVELPDTSWTPQAACHGLTPLMFPDEPNTKDQTRAINQAKAVCAECPVLAQCRDWALAVTNKIEGGVIAGMYEDELAHARRTTVQRRAQNRARRCGTPTAYAAHLANGERCDVCLEAHNRKKPPRAQKAS